MKVVCIRDSWCKVAKDGAFHCWFDAPVKGEIYTVLQIQEDYQGSGYELEGFEGRAYSTKSFRPVDDTFGPAICERIEQMHQYEQTINQ